MDIAVDLAQVVGERDRGVPLPVPAGRWGIPSTVFRPDDVFSYFFYKIIANRIKEKGHIYSVIFTGNDAEAQIKFFYELIL